MGERVRVTVMKCSLSIVGASFNLKIGSGICVKRVTTGPVEVDITIKLLGHKVEIWRVDRGVGGAALSRSRKWKGGNR